MDIKPNPTSTEGGGAALANTQETMSTSRPGSRAAQGDELVRELQGTWRVTVTERGPAHLLNVLGDVKHVTGNVGHNNAFGNDWGWFTVEVLDAETLVLNYSDVRNPSTLRAVRDHIQRDGDGWIGKLYYFHCPQFQFRLDR